jgi:hypothetical protein
VAEGGGAEAGDGRGDALARRFAAMQVEVMGAV